MVSQVEVQLRAATAHDIDEIIRLAHVMWRAMGYSPDNDSWQAATRSVLHSGFEHDTFRCVVAEDPNDAKHLVACGIATYYMRTPAFWLPNGRMGYVQWMSTEPDWQRKGLARRILDDLVAWLRSNEVARIELHATDDGVALYEAAGFGPSAFPNMWLAFD
jgi:GNAT superfamily N-acetyltransferase